MSRIRELADQARNSDFSRNVVGPRIARPVASWLESTFPGPDAAHMGSDPSVAPPPLRSDSVVVVSTPEADTEPAAAPASDPSAADDAAAEAAAPGRFGRLRQVAVGVKDRIAEHNLVVVAAGIAFWGLLAIPAVLFATVAIAGLVLDADTVRDQVESNLDGLPEEARTIIADQLENVSGGSTGGLITGLVLSLLLALWSSSGAMAKLMATLNTVYGVSERRSFPKLRGLALGLTFGGIVFVASAAFLLTVLPALLARIEGVGDSIETLFVWLRYPALGLVMVIALGVLYHVGPDRRDGRYRLLSIGAIIATVLWVALSAAFSFYTATLASYNETYGSLGGLVVLLLWLFITAFVVLIGAEIHALTARTASAGA